MRYLIHEKRAVVYIYHTAETLETLVRHHTGAHSREKLVSP